MNIFLLYTARISSSFSALSYTFSLALRMKYHQIAETDDAFTREDKKHVFWTTRHLLACVSITGGLPSPRSREASAANRTVGPTSHKPNDFPRHLVLI